jgi:inosine-uridine nucleoside N-ribohydrolase
MQSHVGSTSFVRGPSSPTPTWLDIDAGHDKAMALILAGYSPQLRILGVSTVAGNQTIAKTTTNALRVLDVSGLGCGRTPVSEGAAKPLIRPANQCEEIHGNHGIDGTNFPLLQQTAVTGTRAFEAMRDAVRSCQAASTPLTLIATGPLTNVALLRLTYPELFTPAAIRQIVLMGGVGVGNTGSTTDFNIECDPEAASLIFDQAARGEGVAVPVVVVPLEVTHTALVIEQELADVRSVEPLPVPVSASSSKIAVSMSDASTINAESERWRLRATRAFAMKEQSVREKATAATTATTGDPSTRPTTPNNPCVFATLMCELLRFFNEAYKTECDLITPPLRDPCAVFYVLRPELFNTRRMRIDVECANKLSSGRIVCDMDLRSSKPFNVTVAFSMDVEAFWQAMMRALRTANLNSGLDRPTNGDVRHTTPCSDAVRTTTRKTTPLMAAHATTPEDDSDTVLSVEDSDIEEGEVRMPGDYSLDSSAGSQRSWPKPPLLRNFHLDPQRRCVAMVAGAPVGPHALGDHPINRALSTDEEKERCAEFTAVLTFTAKTEPMELASEVVRQLQSRQVLTPEQEIQLEWIRFGPTVRYSKQYYLSFHTAVACKQFVLQIACRESCGFKMGGMYGHSFKVPSKSHPIFEATGTEPMAASAPPVAAAAAAATSAHRPPASSPLSFDRFSGRLPVNYQFQFDEPLLPGLHASAEGMVEMEVRPVKVERSQQAIRHRMMLTVPMPPAGRPQTSEEWLLLLQNIANELHKRMILRYVQLAWMAPRVEDDDPLRITLALQVRPGLKAFYIILNSPQLRQTGWQASAYSAWLLLHLRTQYADLLPRFCEAAFVQLGNGEDAAAVRCSGPTTCKFNHDCDKVDELIQMRKQARITKQIKKQQGEAKDSTSSRSLSGSHARSRSPGAQQARGRARSRSRERDNRPGVVRE